MPKSGEHKVGNIDSFFRQRPSINNVREGELITFLEDGKLIKQEKRNGVVYQSEFSEAIPRLSTEEVEAGVIREIIAGAGLTGGGIGGEITLNVVGGTGITANANDIAIDSTVVTLTGTQTLSNKTLASPTFTGTAQGANLTLTGDLTVGGTTTTLNAQNLQVKDKNIVLNYLDGDASSTADGAGITIQDAVNSITDATILWDNSSPTNSPGEFDFSHSINVTGNISLSGTVDGRDIATDGSKLDGIEALADVTDTTNVTAAGALMDSEVDADIKTLSLPASTTISSFAKTYLDDGDTTTFQNTIFGTTDVALGGQQKPRVVTLDYKTDSLTAIGSGDNFIIIDASDNYDLKVANFPTVIGTTGTINANEFARFTNSTTLEALTAAETVTALGLDDVPTVSSGSNDRIATFTGTSALQGESNLTFNSSNVLYVNGSVGIGATSPSASLEISKAGGEYLDLDISGISSGTSKLRFLDGGTAKFELRHFAGSALLDANLSVYDHNTSSEALTVQAGGNVGIGTTSPSKKFVVKGASGDQARFEHNGAVGAVDIYSGTDGGLINVRNDGSTSIINIDARNDRIQLNDSIKLVLGTNNDFEMYHDDTNAVINNTKGDLQIYNNADDKDIVLLSDNGSGGTTEYYRLNGDNATNVFSKNVVMASDAEIYLQTGGESIAFMGVSDANYRKALYANNDDHYLTNRHTGGDLILMSNNGSAGGETERLRFVAGSGTQNAYFSNVNLGIGTTSPDNVLHVKHATTNVVAKFESGDTITYMNLIDNASDTYGVLLGATGNDFHITTGNATGSTISERLRVKSNGNVGIGTDNPSRELVVSNTSSASVIAITTSTTNLAQLALGDTDDDNYAQIILDNSTNKLQIQNGGGNVVSDRGITLDSSENVGIGTTSPGTKLAVDSGTSGTHQAISVERPNSSVAALFIGTKGNSNDAAIAANNSNLTFGKDLSNTYTEYMRIDTSGNVGIGTTSPAYKLDVAGQGKVTNGWLVDNGTTAGFFTTDSDNVNFGASTSGKGLKLYSANTEAMRIDSSGNVLIGRTSAFSSAIVEIQNDATEQLTLNNVSTDGKMLSLYNSGSIVGGLGNDVTELVIYQGTTEAIRIDTSQNVGIGTTSPSKKLEVAGDVRIASGGDLILSDSGGGNDTFLYNDSQTFITYVNGAERLRINSSGNVGIGTSSPSFKLKVNVDNGTYTDWETIAAFQTKRGADSETEAGIMISSLGDALGGQISSNWYWTDNVGTRGNTGRSAGIFGIANSTTTNSEFYWQTTPHNSNTLTTRMELDGATSTLHVDGDVVAYSTTTSDARLKDNVKTIDNGLDKIMQLRGVEFDWNATSRKGQHDIGLIAQEVEKVIPEIVREKEFKVGEFTNNKKTFKTIDYEKLVGVLIEAVKEQQEQINELKEKLNV